MKVTATANGFAESHLKEPGMEFHIPNAPTRKIAKTDDAITKGLADKQGMVPCAFASSWMRPGWATDEPRTFAPRGHDTASTDGDEI